MSDVLRVGVVGLGLMGRRMLGSFRAHGGFEVVAGFDRDPETSAGAAREFGLEPVASVETLLARGDLDLVYVATPPASHVAIGKQVLASGRPLFIEKPLAVDLAEAESLVALAEASALPAAVNFPFATLPGLKRMQRELASGEAGAPLRVEIELHFSQWPRSWHTAGPWLAGDAEGGFLREVFSHFAYLTQRLLEPLEVVSKSVTRTSGETETRIVADLRAGDVPVSLVGGVSGAAPDFNRWTLFCGSSSYRVEDWSKVRISDGSSWQPLSPEPGESRDAGSQLDELTRLLEVRASRLPSLRHGLNVMQAVESLLR